MGDKDEENCIQLDDDDALLESAGDDSDSSISDRMEIYLDCASEEDETHSNTSQGLDPRLADSPSPANGTQKMDCNPNKGQPPTLKTKHSSGVEKMSPDVSEELSSGSGDDADAVSSDHGDENEEIDLTEDTDLAIVGIAGVNGATFSSGKSRNDAANKKLTSGNYDYDHMKVLDSAGKGVETLSEEDDGGDDESVPPPIEALESASADEVSGLAQLSELMRNSRQPPVLTPEKSTGHVLDLPTLVPRGSSAHAMKTRSSSAAAAAETPSKASSAYINIASKPLDSASQSLNQSQVVPVTLVGTAKGSSSTSPQQVFALAPQGVLPSLPASSASGHKTITLTTPSGSQQTVYLLPVSMAGSTQGPAPMVVPGVGRVTLAPVSQGQVVNKGQSGGPPQQIRAPGPPVALVCAPRPPVKIAPAPTHSPPPAQPVLKKIAPGPPPPPAASTHERAQRKRRRKGAEGTGITTDSSSGATSSSSPSVRGTVRIASPTSICGTGAKRILVPKPSPATAEVVSTAAGASEPSICQGTLSQTSTSITGGAVSTFPATAPVMTASAFTLTTSTAASIPVVSRAPTVSTTIGSVGALCSAQNSVPGVNASLAIPVNASGVSAMPVPGVAQVFTSSASAMPLLTVAPSTQPGYLLLMPSGPSSTQAANLSKAAAPKETAGKGDPKAALQMKSSVDADSVSKLVQSKNPIPSHAPAQGRAGELFGGAAQVCLACGDSFLTQTGIDSHLTRLSMVVHHFCDRCQRVVVFHNKCALLLHVRQHQTDTSAGIPNNSIVIKSVPEDYAYLKRHMWQYPTADGGALHCWECQSYMRNGETLQQHFQCQRMVMDASYYCPVCHMYLPGKCAFSAHKRMHLMLPPWVCPDCGLQFLKGFKDLLQHMFSECHHFFNICTFKCMAPYCSKTTVQRQDLRQHLLLSHGRAYCKCPLCQMAFTQMESLHQHHKEKHPTLASLPATLVFRCFVCNFPTNSKTSFVEHMNGHMKATSMSICRQLQCLHCWSKGDRHQVTLQLRASMQTHFQMHHSSDALTCGLCFQKFPAFSSLLLHQMDEHSSAAKEIFSCFSCSSCRYFFAFESLKEQHVCDETFAESQNGSNAVGDVALDIPESTPSTSGEAQMAEEQASTSFSVGSLPEVPATSARPEKPSSASLAQPSSSFSGLTLVTSQGANATKTLSSNNLLLLAPASLASTSKGLGNAALILKGPVGIPGNGKLAQLSVVNGTNKLLMRGEPMGLKNRLDVRGEEEEEDVGEMDSSTVLVCRVCFTGIKGKMNLSEHIKEHQDKGTVVCRFCQRMEFAGFNDLADHEKTCMLRVREKAKPKEDKPRIFPCHLCGLVFNVKSAHDAHVEEVHKASRRQFCCTLCSRKGTAKTFHRAEHLERHLVTHRIPKTQVRELMQVAIKATQVAASSQPAAEAPKEASGDPGSLKKLRVGESGPYTCAKCGFQTEEKQVFEEHIKQHYKSEDGMLCPECGMCYAALPSLKKHLALVHKVQDATRYVMGLGLDKVLAASDPLPPKEEVAPDPHSGGVAHECRVCYRQFDSDTQLHAHMRTHGMAFIRSRRFTSRTAKSSAPTVGGGAAGGGSSCDVGSNGGGKVGGSRGGSGGVGGSGNEQGVAGPLAAASAAAAAAAATKSGSVMDASAKAIKREALDSEDGEVTTPVKKKAQLAEAPVRIKEEPQEVMEEG